MKRTKTLLDGTRLTFLAAVLVLLIAIVGCTADTDEGQPNAVNTPTEEAVQATEPPPTTPEITESAPPTEEVTYSYAPAQVDEVTVMVDIDAAEPVKVRINGQLRSGCEELHEHSVEMVDDTTFAVELIAKRPEGVACTMILKAYETSIPLPGTADLPAGEYTVVVNDEVTTTFVWPGMTGEAANIPAVDIMVDETIFNSIMTETVPEVEGAEGLPFWKILPAHTAITLDGYVQSDSLHSAQMWVYPVEALTAVNETAAMEVEGLRQLLEAESDLTVTGTLPYLPLTNAAQALHAQAEYLDFADGSGIRYLTQYGQAANPVTNQELVYTFQGLTTDGAYYVAAVLPVSHPDLPADIEDAPAEAADDYQAYLAGVVEMLNQADPASFTPALPALDEIMTSLTFGESPAAGAEGTAVHSEFDLVTMLEDAGAEVALSTEPITAADILSIPGNIIFANGAELQLYIYDTAEAAMSDAERISADGLEVAPAEVGNAEPSVIEWDGPPHFYRWDNIIVLYVGEDSDMLNLLSQLLGEPFAG